MIPKVRPYKPDFMAPGPRVVIEKEIPSFEEGPATLMEEILDHEVADPLLEDYVKKARYYESKKALGHLYRAIDEKKFLSGLQVGRRTGSASEKSVLRPIWAYVTRETQGIQWAHLKGWAEGIREE